MFTYFVQWKKMGECLVEENEMQGKGNYAVQD